MNVPIAITSLGSILRYKRFKLFRHTIGILISIINQDIKNILSYKDDFRSVNSNFSTFLKYYDVFGRLTDDNC